jgi:hypothetical protein
MEPKVKKVKNNDHLFSTSGSPALINYRRERFEKGLPTVMKKTYIPTFQPITCIQRFNYTLNYESSRGSFGSIPRDVIGCYFLKYLDTETLFSFLYVSKLYFDLCYNELLRRCAMIFPNITPSIKTISCYMYYATASMFVSTYRQQMHCDVDIRNKIYIAYGKLNKNALTTALCLSYKELPEDIKTETCIRELVETSIRKNVSIDNLTNKKAYILSQIIARRDEDDYITNARTERIELIVSEFKKYGYSGDLSNLPVLIETFKFRQYESKMNKFLKMDLPYDNPFMLINPFIPTFKFGGEIFSMLESPLNNMGLIRHILTCTNLFEQDAFLFNMKIESHAVWVQLIKSIVATCGKKEITFREVCCVWDVTKMELVGLNKCVGVKPKNMFGVDSLLRQNSDLVAFHSPQEPSYSIGHVMIL